MLLDESPLAGDAQETATDGAETDAQEQAPETPREEPGVKVELKPKSRRAEAVDKVNNEIKTMREEWAADRRERQEADRRRDEMLAAAIQRPVYVQQQQQQAPTPSPDELERQAAEALDRKDMAAFQRLSRQAAVAEAEQRFAPRFQQQQAPQGAGIHPAVLTLFAAHPEVAKHPRHAELLDAKVRELQARGFQEGPGLAAKAFEEVDAMVKAGKTQGRAQFSQSTAAAISGAPAQRSQAASSGSDGSVTLTAEMRKWQQKSGMSEQTYAKWLAQHHPELISR